MSTDKPNGDTKDVGGMTRAEVSDALGLSKGEVRKAEQRGLKKLKASKLAGYAEEVQPKSTLQILGEAMTEFHGYPFEDTLIAVRAADTLSKRLKVDVAICGDLSTVPLTQVSDAYSNPILEIVKYEKH